MALASAHLKSPRCPMKRRKPVHEESLKELQKDPEFIKEVENFIKASLRIRKYP